MLCCSCFDLLLSCSRFKKEKRRPLRPSPQSLCVDRAPSGASCFVKEVDTSLSLLCQPISPASPATFLVTENFLLKNEPTQRTRRLGAPRLQKPAAHTRLTIGSMRPAYRLRLRYPGSSPGNSTIAVCGRFWGSGGMEDALDLGSGNTSNFLTQPHTARCDG